MHNTQPMHEIQLHIEGMQLDYASARAISETVANHIVESAMCIAWYDGQKQEEHPAVPECQHKPGWLAYAEGHGGRIKVELNDGEFVFIFASVNEVEGGVSE
ncbi:MAG TPA: AF1514 family protein [Gammaproteobacteria bacterium]